MLVAVMLPEQFSGSNEVRERQFQAACHEAAELVRATGGELLAAQKIDLNTGKYLQLNTTTHHTDGFFAAVLQRK